MSTSQIALLASVQQFLDRQHGLYIDGAPCAAQSENRLTVWDPATGQAIATTADASPADVDRAVMSAWRAFVDRRWAGRPRLTVNASCCVLPIWWSSTAKSWRNWKPSSRGNPLPSPAPLRSAAP
ncbi:phenylacetaldehyde dehydrogenase [Klebsiella pneumoniae]|nr:phenylacetaldehyde dehydrogenase [Klebsiella pneumoniae]